ncbi:hypothetical protein LXL04_034985 [Taraxacum kok-saghyz]
MTKKLCEIEYDSTWVRGSVSILLTNVGLLLCYVKAQLVLTLSASVVVSFDEHGVAVLHCIKLTRNASKIRKRLHEADVEYICACSVWVFGTRDLVPFLEHHENWNCRFPDFWNCNCLHQFPDFWNWNWNCLKLELSMLFIGEFISFVFILCSMWDTFPTSKRYSSVPSLPYTTRSTPSSLANHPPPSSILPQPIREGLLRFFLHHQRLLPPSHRRSRFMKQNCKLPVATSFRYALHLIAAYMLFVFLQPWRLLPAELVLLVLCFADVLDAFAARYPPRPRLIPA